ncbi:hypothetical protein I0C86_28340 [Plantactinospora sp. S1510]|uniref:Uncharacterized protein n=1 Tax=Plantactinospora alkalitolerans TaxID=2789879 RepID=A0ABS0H3Y7_9ACTN|nr:hypothetical protein [Plantactinospora alkalitolerans]MBF9132837.1 hypothetical protein [Plantactinospora alkalitolerans]
MTQNNSPDWDRLRREWTPPEPLPPVPAAHSAQPEPYADLFAALDRADQWNHNEPVTCGRAGPDGEVCVRAADHPGCHWDSVLGGSCWSAEEPTGPASYCDRTEDR